VTGQVELDSRTPHAARDHFDTIVAGRGTASARRPSDDRRMTFNDKMTWKALSAELSHAQDEVAAAMVRLTRMPRPVPGTEEATSTFDTLGTSLDRVDRVQQRISAFLRRARV
jgi:hypothetical protein